MGWCVLEIFTYFHAGCSEFEEVHFLPILRRGHEPEDRATIDERLAGFDVSNCRCFDERETVKLLNIIRVGFGELSEFNRVLLASLVEAGVRRPSTSGFSDQ